MFKEVSLEEAMVLALSGKLEEDNRVTSKDGYDLTGDAEGYKITKNGKLVKSFGRVDKETALVEFDEFINDNLENKQKMFPEKFTSAIDIHINIDKLGENYTDNAKQVLRDLMQEIEKTTGLPGGKKELKYKDKVVGYYKYDDLT